MLINLLILPILIFLGIELVVFIKLAAKYRSGRTAWALFAGVILLNFALYEGVLYVWPGSYLDRYQHDHQASQEDPAGIAPTVVAPSVPVTPATSLQLVKPVDKPASKSGH